MIFSPSLLLMALMMGIIRLSSSSGLIEAEPGRVDSPPISIMSAPSSVICSTLATAFATSSKYNPPSEKESGVTLRTPMTSVLLPGYLFEKIFIIFYKEIFLRLLVVLDIQVSKPGVFRVNRGRDDITHPVIKRLVRFLHKVVRSLGIRVDPLCEDPIAMFAKTRRQVV